MRKESNKYEKATNIFPELQIERLCPIWNKDVFLRFTINSFIAFCYGDSFIEDCIHEWFTFLCKSLG